MGAGASSEHTIRQAVLASLGSTSSAPDHDALPPGLLFTHPSSWRIAHVAQWLCHHDMACLVPSFEAHGVDGQVAASLHLPHLHSPHPHHCLED